MSAGFKAYKTAAHLRSTANEVKFALETARALAQSARQVNQPRRQKAPTRARKAPRPSGSMSTALAPRAEASIMRGFMRGLPDMKRLVIRYDAGNLFVGNGTMGVAGTMLFQPTTGSTFSSLGWVPILPADTSSINASTLGFGVPYVQDVFKHFARIRYHRIHVHCIPWGLGSDTGAQASFVITPYRGAVVAPWGSATVGGAYTCIATANSSASAFSLSTAQGSRGAYSGPCWKQYTLDLTPFIAGGTGPNQNEFAMFNNTGAQTASASIPACFALQGNYAKSDVATLANFSPAMQIVVEIDVDLLDFQAVNALGGVPVGAVHQDVKAPVDVKGDLRPVPLTFRDIVRRREEASSPTQSLLGAELHTAHAVPAAARASSAAMPIPERKPRGA